jgi:NAD/NADP transhydrogenase beta subunit
VKAFPFGITSLIAGIGLYVVSALVVLKSYRGEAYPAWLTALWLIATALVVVGLLVMSSGAVRAFRERN